MIYSKFFEDNSILYIFNHPELWYGKNNSLKEQLYQHPYDQPCILFYYLKKSSDSKMSLYNIALSLRPGKDDKFYIPENCGVIEDLINDKDVIITV